MEGLSSRTNKEYCEVRSDLFCKKLEECGIFFESNDFTPLESKKIFHIIAKDGYLLEATKVYHSLWECRKNTLYVHLDDDEDVLKHMVETFLQPQYVYLVMVRSNGVEQFEATREEIGNRLMKALELHDEKKVILIADRDDGLAKRLRWNDDIFHVSERSVKFGDLTKECRNRLKTGKTVLFQGKKVSLEELFGPETGDDYEAMLQGDILESLVRGKTIRVGSEILWPEEPPGDCYIDHVLRRRDKEVTEADVLCEKEKVVLIAGGAGSGKSALLAKLAVTVKKENPRAWVVLIGLRDCTAALQECQRKSRDTISLEELLGAKEATKRATPLEEFVFRRKDSVVLMLDGIEEVFPDYERLILGRIAECQDAPHILKVVLTARPHVVELLEEVLGVAAFTLQPFTQDILKEFLVAYWTRRLGLEETSKEKCETYATELMKQVSSSAVENHFIGTTPLGAKVLAELFQRSNPKDESIEWEGCREYLGADRAKPKLSQWLIVRLVECFIEKTQTIFRDRTNRSGNTMFNCLYEECLACHRTLAMNEVLDKTGMDHGIFLENRQINEILEMAMLQMGFVKKLNNKLCFVNEEVKKYFVAESLLKELQSANQNAEFRKYFLEVVLREETFLGIRIFLNRSLKGIVDSLPSDLFQFQRNGSYLKLVNSLAKDDCEAIMQLIFKYMNNCQIDGNIQEFYCRTSVVHNAARGGCLNTIKFLVERGANVNIKDKSGQTALHSAAAGGHLDIVKFLVERGVDLNVIYNYYSETALHSAAGGGHLDIVKFLVERGADVNIKDCCNETALHSAAAGGHLDTVKFLVDRGADLNSIIDNYYNKTALHSAAWKGHLDTVKFLVEQGADLNIIDNNYNETALHSAALGGHLDTVKFLVERGADVHIKNDSNWTVLHCAALGGDLDTVKFLVEQGADVNAKDNTDIQKTVLHCAASKGHLDTVKFLMEQGADMNIKDRLNQTAVYLAAAWGHLDTVEFLVERGADVNIKDCCNQTAIHQAVDRNHLNTVKFLVERGVDMNIKDDFGRTALHSAASNGHLDTVKFLVERGANLNIIDDCHNQTALHFAASEGHLDTVKFLVERGADVNIKDNRSRTALYIAAEGYHYNLFPRAHPPNFLDTVKFLVEQGADMNITSDDRGQTALHAAVSGGHLDTVKFLVEQGADVNIKDSDGKTPLQYAPNDGGHLNI